MKKKEFKKKLSLNKQTIARLEDDEMRNIYGAVWESRLACNTRFSGAANDCHNKKTKEKNAGCGGSESCNNVVLCIPLH